MKSMTINILTYYSLIFSINKLKESIIENWLKFDSKLLFIAL